MWLIKYIGWFYELIDIFILIDINVFRLIKLLIINNYWVCSMLYIF